MTAFQICAGIIGALWVYFIVCAVVWMRRDHMGDLIAAAQRAERSD